MLKRYKNNVIILGVLFLVAFIDAFYSLYVDNGTVIVGFLPNSRAMPMLLLKSLISALLPLGLIHAVMFLVHFVKEHQGTVSNVAIAAFCLLLPLSILAGYITFIPYYIYSILKYFKLRKAYRFRI